MFKIVKWAFWVLCASLLIFGGWRVKEWYNKELGGTLMGIGFLLAGFLFIYAAYKNLK